MIRPGQSLKNDSANFMAVFDPTGWMFDASVEINIRFCWIDSCITLDLKESPTLTNLTFPPFVTQVVQGPRARLQRSVMRSTGRSGHRWADGWDFRNLVFSDVGIRHPPVSHLSVPFTENIMIQFSPAQEPSLSFHTYSFFCFCFFLLKQLASTRIVWGVFFS